MGKKDLTLTDYLSAPNRYADLWNAGVFQGKQVILPQHLAPADTVQTKADKDTMLQRIRDLAMYHTAEGCILTLLTLENQETIDYGMPVRIMLKEALAYDKQLEELKRQNKDKPFIDKGEFLYKIRKSDRLYPVFTLIIYWGNEEWTGAKSLHELLNFGIDNEELQNDFKALVPEYPLHFLDLNNPDILPLFQTELRTLFSLYIRRGNKEEFFSYLESHEECRHMDEETCFILGVLTGSKELEQYIQNTEMEEMDMSNAITELIEDGRREGILQGTHAMIETCKEFGLSREETRSRVMEKLSCTEEESRKYMTMYWK